MMHAYALVAICVATIAVGQLIFKHVSLRLAGASLSEIHNHPDALAWLAFAVALYGVTTVLWVMALRDLPLSRAYVFVALGFIIVPLGARFFFGEPLSLNYLLGALMIVIGIVITVV